MAELAGELASVMAVSVITQEVDCAHSGEPVCAAEQPFVIALAKSANNQGVECAVDGEFVVQEPESALVGPEDAMRAEAMPADECDHGAGVEGQIRTVFSSHDPRHDSDEYREVFHAGRWVPVEDAER